MSLLRQDPYFEQVPATRLDGTPNGKFKKRRKALPPGISEHDGKVLTKVKRRAYRLDMSLFNCCGIRFGWSSVIGLIPVYVCPLSGFSLHLPCWQDRRADTKPIAVASATSSTPSWPTWSCTHANRSTTACHRQ